MICIECNLPLMEHTHWQLVSCEQIQRAKENVINAEQQHKIEDQKRREKLTKGK